MDAGHVGHHGHVHSDHSHHSTHADHGHHSGGHADVSHHASHVDQAHHGFGEFGQHGASDACLQAADHFISAAQGFGHTFGGWLDSQWGSAQSPTAAPTISDVTASAAQTVAAEHAMGVVCGADSQW